MVFKPLIRSFLFIAPSSVNSEQCGVWKSQEGCCFWDYHNCTSTVTPWAGLLRSGILAVVMVSQTDAVCVLYVFSCGHMIGCFEEQAVRIKKQVPNQLINIIWIHSGYVLDIWPIKRDCMVDRSSLWPIRQDCIMKATYEMGLYIRHIIKGTYQSSMMFLYMWHLKGQQLFRWSDLLALTLSLVNAPDRAFFVLLLPLIYLHL